MLFSEQRDNHISQGRQIETATYNIAKSRNPIIHIEALATYQGEHGFAECDVLCVQENGEIHCYNEALTLEKWTSHIASIRDGDNKLHVEHVSLVSIQQAIQNILKDRADILEVLHARKENFSPNLLLLLTRSISNPALDDRGTLTLHILAVKNRQSTNPDILSESRDLAERLASIKIPESLDVRARETSFRLYTTSGLLYQESSGDLFIYDLTTLTPQLVQTMNCSSAKAGLSYIRISSDLVATLSLDSLFIVDSKFSSVQANFKLPIPKQNRSFDSSNSESQSPNYHTAGTQLLSYHSPSHSVIVLIGRSLIAVDISEVIARRIPSRKRKRNGLLIDAVGRGSLSSELSQQPQRRVGELPRTLGQIVDPYSETPEWRDQKETLDCLLERGDLLDFDRLMASALEGGGIRSGHDANVEYPPQYKVDYLLSKMFSITESKTTSQLGANRFISKLHLQQLPKKAWELLVQKCCISTEQLEASMKRQNLMNKHNALRDNDVIQTLADYDATMTTLLSLLESPCLLKISEVCHALKISTAKLARLQAPGNSKLLTQGDELAIHGMDPADQMEPKTKYHDSNTPQGSTKRGLFNALLDIIVHRCYACPTRLLTKALKKEVSIPELRNVVDLLRIRLAQNGWLSLYTEAGPAADDERAYRNDQISMLTKVLNCVIDSLGTGGWLLNNSVVDGAAEAIKTVSYMKNEVCAALEGIEEAAYLQGMLGEVLLCGKSALHSQTSRPPLAVDPEDEQKCALPLGLRLDQSISLIKVGAGGELQKRSRRDIGKLKSRRVPEYSFERISV